MEVYDVLLYVLSHPYLDFEVLDDPSMEIFWFLSSKTKLRFRCFLYQNVPPAVLVRFLREHRSEWADFNVDGYIAAALKAGSYAYPGMRLTRFTGSQIIMPLGHTIEHEEVRC